MKDSEKPIASQFVVLREEFDDWAILFDLDMGHGFGINPTAVLVWKLLDGEHTMEALLREIRAHADHVPEDASVHIGTFLDALVKEGLAGFDRIAYGCERPSCETSNEAKPFPYEPPQLINLSSQQTAYGAKCGNGSHHSCCHTTGNLATTCNSNGTSGGAQQNCTSCSGGDCVLWNDASCACVGATNPVSYCATGGYCNFQCYLCYIGSGK